MTIWRSSTKDTGLTRQNKNSDERLRESPALPGEGREKRRHLLRKEDEKKRIRKGKSLRERLRLLGASKNA